MVVDALAKRHGATEENLEEHPSLVAPEVAHCQGLCVIQHMDRLLRTRRFETSRRELPHSTLVAWLLYETSFPRWCARTANLHPRSEFSWQPYRISAAGHVGITHALLYRTTRHANSRNHASHHLHATAETAGAVATSSSLRSESHPQRSGRVCVLEPQC